MNADSMHNLYNHTEEVHKNSEVSTTPLTEGIIKVLHDATLQKSLCIEDLCIIYTFFFFFLTPVFHPFYCEIQAAK